MADPLAGKHIIWVAAYYTEAPHVNHAFVVGADATGAEVSGSAVTTADVDLVGERLAAHHDPAIPSSTVAAAVAAAQLVKARLDGRRAQVTIPPHCGLELWDIVNIDDDAANQAQNYRVSGYNMEYRSGVFLHVLDLCAP